MWFAERFKVLSYNILADYLANNHRSKLYFHIPPKMLEWEWRKRNIIFELGLWSADILCFQVVTLTPYKSLPRFHLCFFCAVFFCGFFGLFLVPVLVIMTNFGSNSTTMHKSSKIKQGNNHAEYTNSGSSHPKHSE